jgi:MoaA/NifB/PqqE/SkfB family radical SAM enzyme
MVPQNELITIGSPGDLESQRVTRLPVLVIHAHSSCNCRCIMCDIWKTKESHVLRPSDLQLHLTSIRRLGVRWVVFSGGEPLLNPDLPSLCSILRRESIRLTLLTTGLLLGKFASQVTDSFDDVIVSLDGPEQIHDAIRRVDKAFTLLQLGIGTVRQSRSTVPLTARTTVQKANHRHLRETVRAAKILGLNGISFLAADLTSEAFNRRLSWPPERQSEVALSLEELKVLQAEIESLIEENSKDIDNGFIAESPDKLRRIAGHFGAHLGLERTQSPQCNAPWTSAVIEADGTVRPCFFHRSIGNVHKMGLEDVINGEDALAFRSALHIPSNPTCNRCVCSLNYRP